MAADGRNWGVERAEVNVDGFDHDSKRQRAAALHPATISQTTDIERAISRGIWQSLRSTFHRYNLETRGIERVLPEERHNLKKLGFVQIGLLWFGVNLAANNITLGMLGPTIFYLSFLDASLCAIFGMLVGCLPVAYIATFGPRSGLRSMILARFSFGWYPAKILVILNIVVLLGYSLLDCVIAGQIMSAVSPNGSLSVIVGIVITAVISWLITTFGYRAFHMYERYAWLPQLIVFSILAGVAGPHFDLYSNPSVGETSATVIGSRISFFSLNLAAAVTYSGGAADLFVYYPEESPRWKVFATTMAGLALSFAFALLVGIGLGSGLATNTTWSEAYGVSQGALIVQGLSPIGTFGSFCSIIIALGLVSNMVLPIYAAGIDFQALNSYFAKIPRVVWNAISCIIFTVCAIAGRAHLAAIFTNFLALMGYWVVIWIAIMLEEHLIFRKWMSLGWNWDAWNDRKLLPVGYAAFVAFLVGWAGAIISMAQVWYIGPLAARIGDYGADLGNFVAFAWAGLVYPPLRWLEVRRFER
ncbi:Vitamin B6 transporter [Oleoguttula sp. CCFEE 5521]